MMPPALAPPSPIITIESPMRTSRCMPPPPPPPLKVSCAPNTCARKSTSPTSFTRMYGVTVLNPSRTDVVVEIAVSVVLPSRYARSRGLKAGLGQSRRSAATRASDASVGSRNAAVASPRARTASTISSRRSASARSGMATHTLSQVLQRAELELLDRPFGSAESVCHRADAHLLDEPHLNHAPLKPGQLLVMSVQG